MAWMIVGLGNHGKRYELTRHNAGYLVVMEMAARKSFQWVDYPQAKKRLRALGWKSSTSLFRYAQGHYFGQEVICIITHNFINCSGKPVSMALEKFGVPVDRLVVIHDDLDMVYGKVKSRHGGSSGGHNGIKSLCASLHSSDFMRIKVGIGRPEGGGEARRGSVSSVSDWVLSRFTECEIEELRGEVVDQVLLRLGQMMHASGDL